MQSVSNDELARIFYSRLADPEFQKEAQEAGTVMLRDHLREEMFCSKILPSRQIGPNDSGVIRAKETDTYIYRAEMEPGSRALMVTLGSNSEGEVIQAPRVDFPFTTVQTLWYQKTEEELAAYANNIVKVIRDNMAKDIGDPYDRLFLLYCETAAQFVQLEAQGGTFTVGHTTANILAGTSIVDSVAKGVNTSGTTADFTLVPPTRADFVRLRTLRGSTKRLRITRALITENDHAKISTMTSDDLGLNNTDDVAKRGWRDNMFAGLKLVVTLKGEILREGNIYGFTDPEFLGVSFAMTESAFWAERRAREISMTAWSTRCIGIGHVNALVKLELYSGSLTAGFVTVPGAGRQAAAVLPVVERDLSPQQNRIVEGGVAPIVDVI